MACAAARTRASRRPSRKSSMYAASALVGPCAISDSRASAASMSRWLPSDTNREKPCPERARSRPISRARFPLWDTRPRPPEGKSPQLSRSSLVVSTTPMQFGPSSRAPRAVTSSASARSSSAVAPPDVITVKHRAPAARPSVITGRTWRGGTATTTCSGGTGSDARSGRNGSPPRVPPRWLTRWTARRSRPDRAPDASQ